jgi:hypothetical protein
MWVLKISSLFDGLFMFKSLKANAQGCKAQMKCETRVLPSVEVKEPELASSIPTQAPR